MEIFSKLSQGIRFENKQKENQPKKIKVNKSVQNFADIKYFYELSNSSNNKQLRQYTDFIQKFMNKKNIQIKGNRIKLPIMSFQEICNQQIIEKKLINKIEQEFKFTELTPIQSLALPNLIENRNQIYISPTGSGKTLAYLLPLLTQLFTKKEKILIIAPVFEISIQIYKVICKLLKGEKTDFFIGHCSNLKTEVSKYDLLVTTPKTFLSFKEILLKENLTKQFKHVVLDEADKYFESSFKEQLEEIFELFPPNQAFYYLFSATYPYKIEDIIEKLFIDKIEIVIGGKVHVLNRIKQQLRFCSSEEGKQLELENIIN